jgi:hypothetical protein
MISNNIDEGLFLHRQTTNSGTSLLFGANNASAEAVRIASIDGMMTTNTDGAEKGYLRFWTADGAGVVERMRIAENGNVGIGTTAPKGILHVSSSGAQSFFERLTAATNDVGSAILFRRTSSGDIVDGFGVRILFSIEDNAAVASNLAYIVATRNGADSSGNLSFWTNNGTSPTEKVTILPSGNVGIGTTDPGAYRLNVVGDAKVSGKLELGGADVAEEFITDKIYPAGTVLVMGEAGYKSAKACAGEYDQKVLGVVSDNASVIMGRAEGEKKAIVAMIGVVKVKVNNSGGAIAKGDLLTTSKIKGEAMRADEPKLGTIIGKALENDTGKGWIMALVNLK